MVSVPRCAIVTGCGRPNGIGAGVARRLAAEGVAVAVTDIEGVGEGLDELAEELAASGSAMACWGDVSSAEDCRRMVAEVVSGLGRPTILVNNAAAPHGSDRVPVAEVPLEGWQRQLDVNLTGQFLMIQAVAPHMVEAGGGRIVNVSSGAALTGTRERVAYAASKAGILGLTRAAAADLCRDGVTVNAICPGAIATGRAESTARREQGDDGVQEALAARAAATPVGRIGTPADIAAAVAYLVSDDAGFVTGQVLVVDGGATTVRP